MVCTACRADGLNKWLFRNGSVWGCLRVDNLATLQREFLALQGSDHLGLLPTLLQPATGAKKAGAATVTVQCPPPTLPDVSLSYIARTPLDRVTRQTL